VRRCLRAEWTKLRTLPGTAWSALAIVALTVAASAATASVTTTANCPPGECGHDPTALTLSGVYLGQNVVIVFAVLAVTGEYATGMIHTTLAATPRRGAVFAAKALVVTATVLGGGLLGVLGSVVAGRRILSANGFTAAAGYPWPSPVAEPTLRAALGTVLYFGLLALLSLGIATAVRDTAVALAAILALLYVFPIVASTVPSADLRETIQMFSPMTAGLAVQATRNLDQLPIGPWAGLGLLTTYTCAAVLLGAVLFQFRDA
jgi:ABC-2 type transport system permease protein